MIDFYLHDKSLQTKNKIKECYEYYLKKDLTYDEIYEEYADQGIHVMAVCPGYTKTNFNKRAKISSKSVPGYIMTSEDVVEESLKAFKNKKYIIINGKINRFAKWLISFLPIKIAMKLSKNIIKKGMDNKRWLY